MIRPKRDSTCRCVRESRQSTKKNKSVNCRFGAPNGMPDNVRPKAMSDWAFRTRRLGRENFCRVVEVRRGSGVARGAVFFCGARKRGERGGISSPVER